MPFGQVAILAGTTDLDTVAPRILQALGQTLGWEVGVFWNVGPQAEELRAHATWHIASLPWTDFDTECRKMTFASGVGLPGRIWASRNPHERSAR